MSSLKQIMSINAIYLFGLLSGLGFQVYIASNYGASHDIDVFLLCNSIVLFFTGSFSTGMNGTLVPLYADFQRREDGSEWVFGILVVTSMFGIAIIFSFILFIFPYEIMKLILTSSSQPIFPGDAELLRWQALSIPFAVSAQIIMQILNCLGRFTFSAFTQLSNSLSLIFFAYIFRDLGPGSLSIAVFLGAITQFSLALSAYMTAMDWLSFKRAWVGIREIKKSAMSMFKSLLPLAATFMAYKGGDIIDRYLSISLGTGYTSFIGYAYKLLIAITTVITVGTITTNYPKLGRLASEGNLNGMRELTLKSMKLLWFSLLFFAMGILGCGDLLIYMLLRHGNFTQHDQTMVFDTMRLEIGMLLFSSFATLFTNVLYSLKKIRIVIYLGLASALATVILKIILLHFFGFPGLVGSVTIGYTLDAIVIYLVTSKYVGGFDIIPILRRKRTLVFVSGVLVLISATIGLSGLSLPIRAVLTFVTCGIFAVVILHSDRELLDWLLSRFLKKASIPT